MDETLEKLVAQFGNPADLSVKVGREKVWPLREGKVISPQWADKLETALNQPDQLKGTVSVKRGDDKLYVVSNGTVELDEREALEELTQVESLAEQAEPEVQPAYMDLLNSRLDRVGEGSLTLDELRTDVEQSRAMSGTPFVNTFDDIVIREGLERNLSREQTLAVLEQSPTLEGLSSEEIAQYRTQFENQYNSESARFLGIPLEPEPVALQDDVTGLPENLPEDESLRQDEGITEPTEFNEEEDIQLEDSVLPAQDLESFDINSNVPSKAEASVEQAEGIERRQVVYPGLDADYIPNVEPAVIQAAVPVPETQPSAELIPELDGVQAAVPEPLIPSRESATAAQIESLTNSFYGQIIDAYQAKFDRPLLSQITVWPDQNHDALFTDAALDQELSIEQFQEGLSQSPHILSQLGSNQSPEAVATHIAPLVASYESQLQAQHRYGESLRAYYEANPTLWQEKNKSLPALTETAQFLQSAQELDQRFTAGAILLDMPKEQYEQALSNSPYVRMQLANQVSLEDITRDYLAPLTAAYETQQTAQLGASIENSFTEPSVFENDLTQFSEIPAAVSFSDGIPDSVQEGEKAELTPVLEDVQAPEPEVIQPSAGLESPYLELLGKPNTTEEYAQLYQTFLHEPEKGVAADLTVQEAALSQGMAADEFLQTITSGPYVQGRLDEGTPIADLNTVYLSQVMTSYLDEQQALEHPQSAVLETGQIEEPINSSTPELEASADAIESFVSPTTVESEAVMESVPELQAVNQSVTPERSESIPVTQFSETINQPLSVPLEPKAQQVALDKHFDFPADALNCTDVVNGVLATAEPRLHSLQNGFATVEFELKNLAQHINEGKFNDWSSTQGQRVKTAAQTMTETVKGRFTQWVDNAKTTAKTKVQEVGNTLKDKFDKAIALVDADKLEQIAPILPSQVEHYKIDTDQGLRISRDGIPVFENGKCPLGVDSKDVVFLNQLSSKAEKHVSSLVDGLATLGGKQQSNGDRTFSVGTYTMSRSENGAITLTEASRGEILHAQNGKIRSSLTAEDYSRFQKFHQNAQVAVKSPGMAQAKGGIEVG